MVKQKEKKIMTRSNISTGSLTIFYIIMLLLIFTGISPSHVLATGLSVRSPQDDVWVSVGTLYLAGFGATSDSMVVSGVRTNSENGLVSVQEGGTFGCLIYLREGMNTIRLKAGNDKMKLKVFYSPDPNKFKPPMGFTRLYVHKTPRELDCKECHRPIKGVYFYKDISLRKGQYNYKSILPARSDCTTKCHLDKGQKRYVHGPVGAGVCIFCHSPHDSLEPKFLQRTGEELCSVCHQEGQEGLFKKEFAHSKIGKGCVGCHNPHESEMKYQLNVKGDSYTDLCYSCHKKAQFLKMNQHGPVKKGECLKCHGVHGSDYRKLLLARFDTGFAADFDPPRYQLCFTCHKVGVFTDKNNLKTGFRSADVNLHYLHVQLTNERGCITCHEVHSSEQQRSMKGNTMFRRKYKIKIQFQSLENGGKCVLGCHKTQEYDRRQKTGR